jgi:prefoldin subunit 5
LNIDFPFITDFCSKETNQHYVEKMSAQLKEIRREIAKLKKDVEELRRLKSDGDQAKKLRKKLVRVRCD